jgi:activating signal cointegrator complex subunit 3
LHAVKILQKESNWMFRKQRMYFDIPFSSNIVFTFSLSEELSSLFTSKNISKENIQHAIDQALKLISWVEENQNDKYTSMKDTAEDDNEVFSDISFTKEFAGEIIFHYQKSFTYEELRAKADYLYGKGGDLDEEEEEEVEVASSEAPSSVNIGWLRNQMQNIYQNPDLANNILSILEKAKDEVELQGQLFDLLGEKGFDLMATIISNKSVLLRDSYNIQLGPRKKRSALDTVSFQTESEKILEKKRRKESRKISKQKGKQIIDDGSSHQSEWLRSLGYERKKLNAMRQSKSGKSLNILTLTREDVFEETKRSDPLQQMRRIEFKGYEEYHVPPPETLKDDSSLVPISEFDDWAQKAFKGYSSLNRVQSRVFHTAYKTNENLLICAPTGCGKTNIAMMAMLHEIGLHFKSGLLRREEFKMIYIAPMKALAQEMVESFSKRLAPLGIVVQEMTGDMQLSKREVQRTQLIVTTPEKWDVVTRKATDLTLIQLVRLIIIDEVHLLNEDRGPVIETIVARTLRQVETTQSMIRIVGLSATLPNYQDVATFLQVNPLTGLFHFDNSYRPVPLQQQYIGVTVSNPVQKLKMYNDICYKKVELSLEEGNQVMVFVHSRKDTANTARALFEIAVQEQTTALFKPEEMAQWAVKGIQNSTNRELKELLQMGFGIHNAGMLRADRSLVEKMFSAGYLRVLVCTATLAWGVNLPAHTVVIKGTEVYNAKKGQMTELGMLDVMQIFGRAGRPQFDTSGEGIIITSQQQLPRYLALLNHALPIESQLQSELANHLGAEIVLGTVTNIREAIIWLQYTYLYIRMLANPSAYGINVDFMRYDKNLHDDRRKLIEDAAKILAESKMAMYDEESGILSATDLGRVASHYYIHYDTIQLFNRLLTPTMSEVDILYLVCGSKEFENVKVRDDEIDELHRLLENSPVKVKGGLENTAGKVNILLQTYISYDSIKSFSLVSDCSYVVQSVGRIVRALFEIAMRRSWSGLVDKLLTLSKCIEKRMWTFHHPLRQFPQIPYHVAKKLEEKNCTLSRLIDMSAPEIGAMVNVKGFGDTILNCIDMFPTLELDVQVQPITYNVIRIQLLITPTFKWNLRIHGETEPWWIWIEDESSEYIYHSEYFILKRADENEPQTLTFVIPIKEPRPTQYFVRAVSDRWLNAEAMATIPLRDVVLPDSHPPHTSLLPLTPLHISALNNPDYESLFTISHFNPIQTQVFHNVYHTDNNVLLGAPTGSGKTVVAELAMLRLFNTRPKAKVVYIAPLKALVRERMVEWEDKFVKRLKKRMVELTGDFTPDVRLLKQADIVITTPEKWDGISRNWQNRGYVRDVGLIVMDEIHLLGSDRGAILEVIVSRMRYIAWSTQQHIRLMGLSTALANARDLADWLGIDQRGLYNFRPSVRPVPISVHIQGFPGQHYCPRMASMNKPTYAAILQHSRKKPVLVFVSSRRQTRLTASDLISYCAADENPQQFVRMNDYELESYTKGINEAVLKHTLQYGIGIHHAGLSPNDKAIVEKLFVSEKIQVLVCTSTLAWGVNFPAHLVVIKGTEFFDPKTKRYEDYPITDVLQMMGRAGRPQFDNEGKAVVMVQDVKKNFYKKFLYEPFPVESSLQASLHDHINAEIASGTIKNRQDAIEYLTWTFMFRRLVRNPTYYGLEDASYESLNSWLSDRIGTILEDLTDAGCITCLDDKPTPLSILESTSIGSTSSFYYMSYHSAAHFNRYVREDSDVNHLLQLLCEAKEFEEIPVRHNEDKLNETLAEHVEVPPFDDDMESPYVKTFLLLQAHFGRVNLPIVDYSTDLKTVLDSTIRIIQAYIDIAAEKGYLSAVLNLMHLLQMILQGRWYRESSLMILPGIRGETLENLEKVGIDCIPQVVEMSDDEFIKTLKQHTTLSQPKIAKVIEVKQKLPQLEVSITSMDRDEEENTITLSIDIYRKSKLTSRAYTPVYTKSKDEGYWLVVGDLQNGVEISEESDGEHSDDESLTVKSGELLALKRIRIDKQTSTELVIPNARNKKLELFLMSDAYIGLDQQIQFSI